MTQPLRPYQFIGTPVTTLVLDAIVDHCQVGGCITPGVRGLAAWADVSLGVVSDCLKVLVKDGWISYDGRVIMLLRHPDRCTDQTSPQGDRRVDQNDRCIDQESADRCIDQDVFRSTLPNSDIDRRVDQFERDMVLTTTRILESESEVAVVDSGGMQGGDQRADRSQGAAQLMAELGANPKIIADAYAARADWTAQQVRARWEYDQKRIAASDGKLNEGVFFTALRGGELAPARPDPTQPIPVAAYADDPGFALGSDTSPPGAAESIRDHAARLLPPPTAATHREYIRDWMFVQGRLGSGDSDSAALAALSQHRSAVRR